MEHSASTNIVQRECSYPGKILLENHPEAFGRAAAWAKSPVNLFNLWHENLNDKVSRTLGLTNSQRQKEMEVKQWSIAQIPLFVNQISRLLDRISDIDTAVTG